VSARGPLSAERLAQIRETQLGDWYSGEWVQDYVESDGEEPAHYVVTERESNTVLAMLPDWAGPIALWMADAHEAVPELLAEVERLRAERDAFCDRVDTLTEVAKGNKRHVQEMFAQLQTAQRKRDEALARVAELEQHTTTVRAEVLREAADAVAERTGNPIDSNAKMLRRMAAEGGGPA
jgi:hypothetical protein